MGGQANESNELPLAASQSKFQSKSLATLANIQYKGSQLVG